MTIKEWLIAFCYTVSVILFTSFVFTYDWFENVNQSSILLSVYALTVVINLLIINNIEDEDMREDFKDSELAEYFSYEQVRNVFYIVMVIFSPVNLVFELLNFIFDRDYD